LDVTSSYQAVTTLGHSSTEETKMATKKKATKKKATKKKAAKKKTAKKAK
jgi:hypothetical protein